MAKAELESDQRLNAAMLKEKHPSEWILLLWDGKYVHAKKLQDAYAKISDISEIVATLRPYKRQELLLY